MKSQMKLADGDLWQISSQMNGIKWRALGRTLGMAEDILMNLESAHKGSGVRECAYQMLLNWKVMRQLKQNNLQAIGHEFDTTKISRPKLPRNEKIPRALQSCCSSAAATAWAEKVTRTGALTKR